MMAARNMWAGEIMENGESLVQSGSEEEQLDDVLRPQRPRFSRKRPLILAASAAVLGVVAVAGVANHRRVPREDTEATTQLFVAEIATAMSAMQGGAKLMQSVSAVEPNLEKEGASAFKPFQALKEKLAAHPGVSDLKVNLTEMSNMSRQELLHPKTQDRQDGNICADDEELHADLCYKKCSTITEGKYPIRTTAFGCCMEEPCSFFNTKFTSMLKMCNGFDVSGNAEGKGCPHLPGTCMANEEFSLGVCYQKCAILTNNTFPYRSAASSCCRYKSHIACLDATNTISDLKFDVGGGMNDGHASTPNMTHGPIQSLTESNVPVAADPSAFAATAAPTAATE